MQENDPIKEYTASRRISGELELRLNSVSGDEKTALLLLLKSLSPSANTLREILRLCDEISQRDNINTAVLLSSPEITAILAEDGGRKERQKKLRNCLESIRYPELSAIKQELQECSAELAELFDVRLELPEDLEGDGVRVSLSARSADDFLKLGEKLKQLGAHPACRRVFSVLCGEKESS